MARLDRMLIQGVRSFGPEDNDAQCIKFMTPLIIILGQNGCGKTTIIESLKYAVTGEMPPRDRHGQSFLYDPNISRKIDTHGRISLQFSDATGDKLLVTRLMQLTQRAKKLEFISKDSVLSRIKPDGQRVDISGRCANLDVEVCTALGVSKSILNNVIFCHQEDSTWPLDKGNKIKEKFDEIFDATKYNKHLEQIRFKRKVLSDNVKLLNSEIEYLKNIKEEAINKKKQLQDSERCMGVSRDQIEKYNKKLQPIIDRLDKIRLQECDIMKLYTEKEKKKTELEGIRANQRELERNIQSKFEGSTGELEEYIQRFQLEMKEKEKCCNELNTKLSNLVDDDTKLQRQITQEEIKKGILEGEVQKQQETIDIRNKQLTRLAEDLETAVLYTQSSENEITSALCRVTRKMKDSEASLEVMKLDCEKEEQELQNKIDGYREEKVSIEQQMTMKTKQLQQTEKEARKIKQDIDEVDMSANRLVHIETKLKRTVQELEQVEKSVNIDELKEEIRQTVDKRNCLEEQLDVVDQEVKLLQEQSSIQAELDIKKESKTMKKSEIHKLKNKNEDTLKHLLKTIPEQGIKYELKQLCIDQMTGEIKTIGSNLIVKQRELTTLETNRRHQKDVLRNREEDLRVQEELIFDACGGENYDDVVKRLQETIQDLQDQKGKLSSSQYMFHHYIQKLQQPEPCCPLCHREFNWVSDVRELIQELNGKVSEVSSQLRENSSKLDSEQKKYAKLLELKSTYESITTLRNTQIPNLRNELDQTEKKFATLKKDVANLESNLMELQTDKEMAEKVQLDVVLLDQHCTEVQKLQREIERLEAKLPPGSSSQNMHQALTEQEQMKTELSMAHRKLETLLHKLTSHTDRLQKLREDKKKLTEERLKVEGGVQQRRQLEEKQELQAVQSVLNEEVDTLREELGLSKTNLDSAIKEKNKKRLENKDRLKQKESQISGYWKRVDEINLYQTRIREFEQQGVTNKLIAVRESLHELGRNKDDISRSIQDLKVRIDGMKSDLSKQQMKKRDLDDNLKLRGKQEEAVVLRRQIEDLEESLGDLKYETLSIEKRQLQKQEDALNREKSEVEGRLREQQSTILSLSDDLKKPMYKDAEKDYLHKVIKKKVKETTINDLLYYYKATAWAMTHFCKERMREINTIIRELWRQIYRGNDIDYIEIKTDFPEEIHSDRRRNYNYHVVQIKNDVEIDMKGCCSAGQKVLASLIIRMALAETFSGNCGMLALDEPTTNLDRENIESLSIALADIVNARMIQKNFQLIIITHNEEFLDRLLRVEKLETYYRVVRNEDGKSVIEKHRVETLIGDRI